MSPITETTETPNQPYQLPDDRRKTADPRPANKQAPIEAFRRESTGQFFAMAYQDRMAYEKFCDEIVGDYNPKTHRERSLAVAIAEDTWRLSKARAIENNIFALGMSGDLGGHLQANSPEVFAAACQAQVWLKDGKNLQMLSLYESRIRRSVEKNEKQLKELQAERIAQYNQALEEEKLLARLDIAEAAAGSEPLEAELSTQVNGFGFSTAEVFRIVRREMRLEKVRLLLNSVAKQNKATAGNPSRFSKAA